MCGIVGIIAKSRHGFNKDHDTLFTELLYADALRGADSTGAFSVNMKNHVRIVKQATNPGIFQHTAAYRNFTSNIPFDNRIVIGHNRKATWGSVSTKNAHPFTNGKIVLVHNGYIANHEELAGKKVDVDSEAIVEVLDKEKDVVKGLDKLCGAFAIVWYNHETKRLYLARNDQRTLAVAYADNHVYLASEKEMLVWILNRNKISFKSAVDISNHMVWTLSFDPFKIESGKIEETKIQMSRIPRDHNDLSPWENSVATDLIQFNAEFCGPSEYPEGGAEGQSPVLDRLEKAANEAKNLTKDMERETQVTEIPSEVKRIMELYPADSQVLFVANTVVQNTTYIQMEGECWIPGKEPVKARFNVLKQHDKEEYLERDVPLDAIVACPARKGDNYFLMLKGIKLPSEVIKDGQNTALSANEWKMVARNYLCNECQGNINSMLPEKTLIMKGIKHSYEVTCHVCVADSEKRSVYGG